MTTLAIRINELEKLLAEQGRELESLQPRLREIDGQQPDVEAVAAVWRDFRKNGSRVPKPSVRSCYRFWWIK